MSADPERKTIMLVDDDATTLEAGKKMLRHAYRVYPILSGAILLDLLEHVLPDLILLDVEMPDMDGYQVITLLKNNPKWESIPVVFLTSRADEGSELQGLSMGAVDYITKPFSAPRLVKRIRNHLLNAEQNKQLKRFNTTLQDMVAVKALQLAGLQNSIIGVLTDLVEFRDYTTGGHAIRTQTYMQLMTEKMIEEGIYKEEASLWDLEQVISASQLHDIGKIAISDTILHKPGKLTRDEFESMKKHVEIGVQAIRKIENDLEGKLTDSSFLYHARMIAGSHHEKWDGTGYPMGLRGLDIPLEGRLMAIADVYDALTSVRPYKQPMAAEEAKRTIENGSESHFDPQLVDIFTKVADQFAEVTRTEAYRNKDSSPTIAPVDN
ncbi:MAG: response regulator [Proteobacteria bacterium]|nr:response regulator [Pseudomonadota bacterium]